MPALPANQIFFGADYNPEQWPESIWPEDMRLMKEAGVNLATIGVFSWSRLQTAPGEFHFDWLDRLMDLLERNGIRADLATATASPPHWLVRLHPEILPTLADGTILHPGSRQHYNPSSAAYRAACAELVEALAARYKDHPALAMWHINNEYACHVPADHGTETAAAFREWLRRRHGSLDALNDAWGTSFWSQHYQDWEEVLPPRATPTFPNPGQLLDFERFSSDALLECLRVEAAILRRTTPDIPITTNFMEWFKPLDYARWALELDFTSIDIYPEPEGSCLPNAMTADMTRSFGRGKPWMVMEQAPTHVQWRVRNASKRAGLMRLWSWQSVARGADGICFFQWRQSRAGAEKFHSAMVGHGDPATHRCFQEAKSLGNELGRATEIAGSRVAAPCAIYFDQENWWALEGPGKPANDLRYHLPVTAFYEALFHANLAVDFVFEDSSLDSHQLLFVPALYMVKPGVAEKISAWVEAGGTAVFSCFSGIVDQHDRVHLGGYPGPLRRLLGLEVAEWVIPASAAESHPVETTDAGRTAGLSDSHTCGFWTEVVRTEGAEPMALLRGGWHAGSPVVTRHRFGKGAAWYLASCFQREFHQDLVRAVARETGTRPPLDAPKGVEAAIRHSNGTSYLFLLNHNSHDAEIVSPALRGTELISGQPVEQHLELPPLGVAVVRADTPNPASG